METIGGLWPGEVDTYDQAARTCRVRIPGITDGSNVLPEAVFCNPLGDRATADDSKDHTEIRILPGDPVWLMFEGGDPRFPIIVGYRTPRAGNPIDWRRWRHKNVELTADETLIINARNVIWNVGEDVVEHIGRHHATDIGGNRSSEITGNQTTAVSGDQQTDVSGSMASTAAESSHEAATHSLTAQTQIAGAITTTSGPGGGGATIQGPVSITGGTVTHDGVNISKDHKHPENNVVGGDTGNPH